MDRILLKVLSGSRAYHTHTPNSDYDYRGVYYHPLNTVLLNRAKTSQRETAGDTEYYDLHLFFKSLAACSPNVFELLWVPEDCILIKNPIFNQIDWNQIWSKKIFTTLSEYALQQLKGSQNREKLIHQPLPREKSSPLDFCYAIQGYGSITLKEWLTSKGYKQENCGLSKINHVSGVYALFHNPKHNYRGIVVEESNNIRLSSIPLNEPVETIIYYNADQYSQYCKKYNEYWQWVEKRNPTRYENAVENGKFYDSKNMMHTFRLLYTAQHFINTGEYQVRLPKNIITELHKIRSGEYTYEVLEPMALKLYDSTKTQFEKSSLMEAPNYEYLDQLLIQFQRQIYGI